MNEHDSSQTSVAPLPRLRSRTSPRGEPAGVPLNWAEASHADREHLQSFVCTYPDRYRVDPATKQKRHPFPWQMRVQTGLRAERPPLSLPARMIVGYDEQGLAAIGMFEAMVAGEAFYIRAIARAYRLSGQHVADETLARVLDEISSDSHHVDGGIRDVFCDVHWKNYASKKMLARAGFAPLGDDGELEIWALDLGAPPELSS